MVGYETLIAAVRDAVARLPRVRLAHLPTPLDDCPRISAELAGPAIMVKREDCTGLAFGGNKVRQHEYVLGAALQEGADCFVQGAAAQSNHSRQLAAAGAKLGIDTYLVPKKDAMSDPVQGNFLVDHILGAEIIPTDSDGSSVAAKQALVERLKAEGRHPYVTGMGADESLVLAAVAYVDALCEIVEQLPQGRTLDYIYTASQGSTQAGLLLGCELLGLRTSVVGVNPTPASHEAYLSPDQVLTMVHRAAEVLGVRSSLDVSGVEMIQDFVGDGYGKPTGTGLAAIRQLAAVEGILLDPVYTGKAFAALIAHARSGKLAAGETVVFLHTGGLPGIFAYQSALMEALTGPQSA
jgi:1-aminocyclopropane-1-carboxylate deaminase/D-cysteine desulfhydrase-like pyridoxal-dependent ACC family enzyme